MRVPHFLLPIGHDARNMFRASHTTLVHVVRTTTRPLIPRCSMMRVELNMNHMFECAGDGGRANNMATTPPLSPPVTSYLRAMPQRCRTIVNHPDRFDTTRSRVIVRFPTSPIMTEPLETSDPRRVPPEFEANIDSNRVSSTSPQGLISDYNR